MTNIDITQLSVKELEVLKNGIDGAIGQKKQTELLELRDKIDELIGESPFTLDEVLAAQSMRKPVLPKYRNPDDADQTWTGRGRQPKWVREFRENGGDLEAITI